MSYNLLAADLTAPFRDYCAKESLKFAYRLPRIIAEIETANADILCLQEVSKLEELEPELSKLGYTTLPFDPNFAKNGTYFTSAMAYKTEKYEFLG